MCVCEYVRERMFVLNPLCTAHAFSGPQIERTLHQDVEDGAALSSGASGLLLGLWQ